jgi:hypothetical protein
MKNITIVYLSGGLGNQLHQLSVALGLREFVPVEVSTCLLGSSLRRNEVQVALDIAGIQVSKKLCKCGRKKVLDLQDISMYSIPCCIQTYPSEAPWMFHKRFPRQYFNLLKSLLENKSTSVRHHKLVIHFRLGDYLWPPTASEFGVLSKAYYVKCLEKVPRDVPISALTDDPVALNKIFGKEIAGHKLQVADSQSVFQDFRLMIEAETLISANSSMSLWAIWYRAQRETKEKNPEGDISPSRVYRKGKERSVPGLGKQECDFWNPFLLTIAHPFVVTRRLKWKSHWI